MPAAAQGALLVAIIKSPPIASAIYASKTLAIIAVTGVVFGVGGLVLPECDIPGRFFYVSYRKPF